MRVLFLCIVDYANLGYLFAEALKSVGIGAICMKREYNPRRSGAEQGLIIKSRDQLFNIVRQANVIIWMHSQWINIPEVYLLGKRLGVFHGGTKYRNFSKSVNDRFNPIVDFTWIQSTANILLTKGAKNIKWVFPPVDTDKIQPMSYDLKYKIVVGHYPSHKKKKGTLKIKNTMHRLQRDSRVKNLFRFICGDNLVSWNDNLDRMSKCDIFINNLGHDGWGLEALEASALGKIVVAGFALRNKYEERYGICPIIRAKDENHLYIILKNLLQKDRNFLLGMKYQSRTWVERYHTLSYIGNELKEILNEEDL